MNHVTPVDRQSSTPDRAAFELDFRALHACDAADPSSDVGHRFTKLHTDFENLAEAVRGRLLDTALAWNDDEMAIAVWLHRTHDEFAVFGHRLYLCFAKIAGIGDERTRRIMALTLFHMGETLKYEAAVQPNLRRDYRKVHGLMKAAMAADRHRDGMRMRVDGRDVTCTLESLYFRALLLARFASGVLNLKQMEILDAWMWQWTLCGVPAAPPGSALRADLDSSEGLRLGLREGDGPSLYLPQGPIEEAYRALVAAFHAGRIVPDQGRAAGFRVEEHFAVLDLLRRGLRQSARPAAARAVRERCDRSPVELLIGLAEIIDLGFEATAPVAPAFELAALDGASGEASRTRHDAIPEDIYDRKRRLVRLLDVSETGLGLEGTQEECGLIAAGDLVAVRLGEHEPLVISKVVRCMPSKTAGHVIVGMRRLDATPQLIGVKREQAQRAPEETTLMFAAGNESSGRRDAYLVSDRSYSEAGRLLVPVGESVFTVQLNRVLERGRGWVLAGFEVVAARPAAGGQSPMS